jgi:hypothetical protein
VFVVNEVQRPDGIVIASLFILTSLVCRAWRTTELHTEKIEVDETAQRFIDEASRNKEIHIVANRRQSGDARDYYSKVREQRQYTHIPSDVILFLEVDVADPSKFEDVLEVRGVEVNDYRVLRAESSTVPNAIAAFLLYLRDTAGEGTHCHFDWTKGNPLGYLLRYLLSGEGTRPRSPTKYSGKPRRILNGAPSSTSPANERAGDPVGLRVQSWLCLLSGRGR